MRAPGLVAGAVLTAVAAAAPPATAAWLAATPRAGAAEASRPPALVAEADVLDRDARTALEEGAYAFCKDPTRPLGARQRRLCALSREVEECEGFAKACDETLTPKDTRWLEHFVAWVAPIARVLLVLFLIAIAVALAIPIVRALAKLRRKSAREPARSSEPSATARVVEEAAPEVTDAELALRLADEHHARGELARAVGLYLAASLTALDRRGALHLGRDRTNGEYVRSCTEAASRPLLREIVREVDRAEFGGAPPSHEGALRVAERARTIVRATMLAVIALVTLSCAPARRGADPAGDELPREVLTRSGMSVAPLETSLATMPIGGEDESAPPVVIVDAERVPLEDEARAHLVRWVAAGGALVLFGAPESWPSELAAAPTHADGRDLLLSDEPDDDDDDAEPADVTSGSAVVARVARGEALTWGDAPVETIARIGEGEYASKRWIGRGVVVGVANDDLFTNVGVLVRGNPRALVAIVRAAAEDASRRGAPAEVRVARAEDGVPPPSSPFAALSAAGLAKGAWHALGAAALLFFACGIRHARARPIAREKRRAFAEHVEATAAFYARARAYTHALGAYGRFIDARLREVLPRGADPVAFLAARSGADPERVAELYARARRATASDEPRGDELRVIEELARLHREACDHNASADHARSSSESS